MKSNVATLQTTGATTAPLSNLAILDGVINKVQNRPAHLPGLAVMSGPSGFGKSTAAAWCAAHHQAIYLEIRSAWTQKALLAHLLKQMGIVPARTIHEMMDQAGEQMACSQTPVLIDEFDNAVRRNLVELVRDLYEQSKCPIVLIGEERLPQMLEKWERFHGRIMTFAQAQPATLDDARVLARHYVPRVEVRDDLLAVITNEARGSVRRIVTNLDAVASFAASEGLKTIGKEEWGSQPLFISQSPKARSF